MPAVRGTSAVVQGNDDVDCKNGVQNGSGTFLDFVGIFMFTKGDVRVPSSNKGKIVE